MSLLEASADLLSVCVPSSTLTLGVGHTAVVVLWALPAIGRGRAESVGCGECVLALWEGSLRGDMASLVN